MSKSAELVRRPLISFMVKMNAQKLVMLALSCILVVPLVLIGGCVNHEDSALKTQIIEDVTPEEAYALIQDNKDNQNFVIIDVRTPEEYASGHIEKAINLDYYSETFKDELNKLDKSKTYLIYCRSGGRSGKALGIMEELDFREVYNMLGGIVQWESGGLPTVK